MKQGFTLVELAIMIVYTIRIKGILKDSYFPENMISYFQESRATSQNRAKTSILAN
ncbi:hypothetical protein GCM10028806_56080 [Spirosoma terrae]